MIDPAVATITGSTSQLGSDTIRRGFERGNVDTWTVDGGDGFADEVDDELTMTGLLTPVAIAAQLT